MWLLADSAAVSDTASGATEIPFRDVSAMSFPDDGSSHGSVRCREKT